MADAAPVWMADSPVIVLLSRRPRRTNRASQSALVAVCDVGCPLLIVVALTAVAYAVGRFAF